MSERTAATVGLHVEGVRVPGGRARLRAALLRLGAYAAGRAERPVELSFALVTDDRMAALNQGFLGHEGPTDVLSFPLQEEPRLVGDVVISVDTARREAERRRHPAYDEVVLYAVHGVLHLLGHDDHDPASRRRMRRAERRVLRALGVEPVFRRRPGRTRR